MVTSLRQQATAGVKWTGMSSVIITGLLFVQFAILARLLKPEDFGLMAMISAVIGFAQSFTAMGVSNAIIHRQDATRDQLSSLYWLSLLTGGALLGVLVIATPLVVAFFAEPRLADLMVWAALIVVINPVGLQFQILLQKELRFDRLAKAETGAAIIGTAVAVYSAVSGQGVYSLIWGDLAFASAKSVLFVGSYWTTWRPTFRFRRSDLKGYLAFGLYQMGEQSVDYFSANVDYLVIGRFLGPEVLGIYSLAYRLVVMPLSKINPILTRVALPIFAKSQSNDSALRQGYLEMVKLLALIVFPILVGLAATAPFIVPAVFGERWTPAIALIQIMAPLGMMKGLLNPAGSILLAKGRTDIGFKWTVVLAIMNTSVFMFAVRYGVYALAWSYVVLSFVDFILERVILRSLIGLRWVEYRAALIRPTVMSAIMGAAVFMTESLLSRRLVGSHTLLVAVIAFGVVVYALLVLVLESNFLMEIWRLVIGRGRKVEQCQGS